MLVPTNLSRTRAHLPSVACVREFLDYDPDTGVFTWLVQRPGKAAPGSVAGSASRIGVAISLMGMTHKAHHLAFVFMAGRWPNSEMVDHRDGDPTNNRWSNLREATRSINMQNQRRAQSRNKSSGLLGVHSAREKWRARIRVNGRIINLGVYATPEAAHQAYLMAKRALHEGCTI